MQLGDWMRVNRISHDQFADTIGCDRSSISRYIAGLRMPRPEVLVRIREATSGAVTADDFLPSVVADDECVPCVDEANEPARVA